ncbi:Acyl-CoA N-acyltransferase [Penicillium vulpinum]|uniref:N-acetyltransferase domain-containing protein n=1 Tax=Penicillium vulpinum TaxID=29845 RepID=A0A1V6RNE1_9EURO|nr:Acyl-CoA N-acyltransferase [Penicillium vulpinum]KAJ5970369.1 Acyl-CoA N-acyltransferase [Penicillium vulpinum]OQE03130.1 hypothetical protein PENVUL_c035G02769 [Penicillium vulpinum]
MAEEIETSLPFHEKNAAPQNTSKKSNNPKSTVFPDGSVEAMLLKLGSLNQNERDKLIQSIENLSWNQTWDLTKQFDKQRRKLMSVQQPPLGMENESHSCPEMLPAARDGPGVDPSSSVYELLAKPRIVEGVEEPATWATADPPDFIHDDGYQRIEKTVKGSNKVESRAHWGAQHKIQVKAYEQSRHIFPIVQNDILKFTSKHHNSIYEPERSLLDDRTLDIQERRDQWRELKHRISSFDLPNADVRKQFRSWWDQLPAGHQVDIYHVAFFDGTAMPDGRCSMFLPDIKHVPTPRNMKDELTRLHWHETSEGYVYNLGEINKRRKKKEQEQQEHLRRTADYRAWLELPPDSKVVPPNIYLRPAEQYDASSILEIMNWYSQNSASSSETESVKENDFEELLQFCRENNFPFVVAARRSPEPLCRNQIHPVVGYAYAKFHRHGKRADVNTGELRVFVKEGSKKQHIGRALVDMVLSCFTVNSGKSTDYEFDQTGTVQYGPGYGRHLTSMLCAIVLSSRAQEHDAWIEKWLERDFGFKGSSDIRYMVRQIKALPASNEVEGRAQDKARHRGSGNKSAILHYV